MITILTLSTIMIPTVNNPLYVSEEPKKSFAFNFTYAEVATARKVKGNTTLISRPIGATNSLNFLFNASASDPLMLVSSVIDS